MFLGNNKYLSISHFTFKSDIKFIQYTNICKYANAMTQTLNITTKFQNSIHHKVWNLTKKKYHIVTKNASFMIMNMISVKKLNLYDMAENKLAFRYSIHILNIIVGLVND